MKWEEEEGVQQQQQQHSLKGQTWTCPKMAHCDRQWAKEEEKRRRGQKENRISGRRRQTQQATVAATMTTKTTKKAEKRKKNGQQTTTAAICRFFLLLLLLVDGAQASSSWHTVNLCLCLSMMISFWRLEESQVSKSHLFCLPASLYSSYCQQQQQQQHRMSGNTETRRQLCQSSSRLFFADRSQIINLVIKVGLLRLLRLPWQQQQWQPIRNTAGNCPLFPFPSLSFFPSTLFLTVNFDGSTSKQSGASTAYYELIAVKRRCQSLFLLFLCTTQSTLNDQFEVQRRRRKKEARQ